MTLKTICRWIFCILFVCLSSVLFISCVNDEAEFNSGSIVGSWINRYEYNDWNRGRVFDILSFDEKGRGTLKTCVDGRFYSNSRLFTYPYFAYIIKENNNLLMYKDDRNFSKTKIYYDDKYRIEGDSIVFGSYGNIIYKRFRPECSMYSFVPQMEYISETSFGRFSSFFDWVIGAIRGEKVKLTCRIFVPGSKYKILDSYLITSSNVWGARDSVNVTNLMNEKGEFEYELSTERFLDKEHQSCSISIYTTYRLLGPVYGEDKNTEKEFVVQESFPALYFDLVS